MFELFRTMEAIMQAWQLEGVGIANLRRVEKAVPEPGRGEILVRTTAVSLNYRDWAIVAGTYPLQVGFPLVLGSDLAGEVVALGPGVSVFKVGDRVTGLFRPEWQDGVPTAEMLAASLGGPLQGVLSEQVVFSAHGVVRTPDVLTDEEASTLPIAALTAWFALVENGGLQKKQWVGIEGTGGVSLFGFQIAKALGARTVAISASEEKLKRMLELGADAAVLRTPGKAWDQEVLAATAGEGVDHFLEIAGGKTIQQAINVLRMGGHIAQIGFLEEKQLTFSAPSLMMKQGRLWGVTVGHRRAFEHMLTAFDQHGIRPIIDRTYTFAETPDALFHLKSGAFGKIVVKL
jgi:NADPH:quinone reductase-like Zn-dependent oxidoreductase